MSRSLLPLSVLSLWLGLASAPAAPKPTPTPTPSPAAAASPAAPALRRVNHLAPQVGIVVRSTENTTRGGWLWILRQCQQAGISRIDLLVKQDEDNHVSPRTQKTLQSGELLVALPGEKTAEGWENSDWLREMLRHAAEMRIEVWAWWPCFHDADAAARFPAAAYRTQRQEVFVDPAVPGVRERQEELLGKLLATYPFSGVALDWVRYNAWTDGMQGPLGARFQREQGFPISEEELRSDLSKARWYEIRAKLLAGWVGELTQSFRPRYPSVRWAAFLEPEQFSEMGISYPRLGRAGLDFLQPMAYWADFKQPPEWAGTTLRRHREIGRGVGFWPTIGIDHPAEEMQRAIRSFPSDPMQGLSFFTYGSWEQRTFDKLREVIAGTVEARRRFGFEAPVVTPPPPVVPTGLPAVRRAEPKAFPAESSLWTIVCLGELYRRGALPARNEDPAVPIVAFHTFAEAAAGDPAFLYKCSTAYLDALFEAIQKLGFNVCPLSRFQSYLITGDHHLLPERPLVLTIDDGSDSIRTLFHPRAQKYRFPYTIAVVTSWLGQSDESVHATMELGKPDPIMTWKSLQTLFGTNLVEIVAHSDGMHYQAYDAPVAMEGTPALNTRQWLVEVGRVETNAEFQRRVRQDMLMVRRRLEDHGIRPPSVFCWPYGDGNPVSRGIAESVGFTHFLLFDHPAILASRESSQSGIPRLPFMRADERVPLSFPQEPAEAQSWWLALLAPARATGSVPLLRAALGQLAPENVNHPQAELTRVALEFAEGEAGAALQRLAQLRRRYPFDPALGPAMDRLHEHYQPAPR